jgi:hypothetical protein
MALSCSGVSLPASGISLSMTNFGISIDLAFIGALARFRGFYPSGRLAGKKIAEPLS